MGTHGWQFLSIFFLLVACWRLGRLAFRDPLAPWGGVALVASLLTIPVAGTSLYIMDQYLTTRSLSAPAVIFILVNALERKPGRAALWAIFCVLIHPLMAVFGLSYAVLVVGMSRTGIASRAPAASAALALPFGFFPPVTDAYREVLETRSYFFLLRWAWYEWLGLAAPMALLWWFHRIARQQALPVLDLLCRALLGFAAFYFAVSVAITVPPGMARFAELQPMRYLHLVYILLFVFAGGLLAQFVCQRHVGRWLLLFVPLCAGMAFAQRELFPATPHLEWPNAAPSNDWVQAFVWIREHTPPDAYFALDPNAYDACRGRSARISRHCANAPGWPTGARTAVRSSCFPLSRNSGVSRCARRMAGQVSRWRIFAGSNRNSAWIGSSSSDRASTGMDCPYRNRRVAVCRVN